MILSDGEILKELLSGTLFVDPLDTKTQLQPASIDIRLGRTFKQVSHSWDGIIRMDDPSSVKYAEYKDRDTFVIAPGDFVLATTMEYVRLPDNLTAFVEGRSSIGRLGIFIQNAGWVDPGFEGEITLELYNANRYSIELKAGTRIGQLVFARTGERAISPYNGKYQGQKGATVSKIEEDFANDDVRRAES